MKGLGFTMDKIQIKESIQLTDKELKNLLDGSIRSKARWKLRDKVDGEYGIGFTISDDDLDSIASSVFDDINSSLVYHDDLVKAIRSIKKFSITYVKRVIKKFVNSDNFSIESLVKEIADEHVKSRKFVE